MKNFTDDITWRAVYDDEKIITETDNKFNDIDHDKLVEFQLMKPVNLDNMVTFNTEMYSRTESGKRVRIKMDVLSDVEPYYRVKLDKDKKLIFSKRITKKSHKYAVDLGRKNNMMVGGGTETTDFIIGWKDKSGNESVNIIRYNGNIELVEDWK